MKIIYHHRTQFKGVEKTHIEGMVKSLISLNHQVDIVSPTTNSNGNSDKRERTFLANIYSLIGKFMPEIFFELCEICYNFVAYKKIKGLILKEKYHLIYERYAIFNWASVSLAKRYNIPIILEVNYTSFTPLYRKRSKLFLPFAHWVDKKIFKSVDGLLPVSTYLKKHLIDLGVDENKIVVLPNAADPNKFKIMQQGSSELKTKINVNGNKIIGFVGGFYPWHGLDFLIDCFARLKKEIPDVCLLLIGDGPVKAELIKKVANLGLKKDVLFVGSVKHDDLANYIDLFDLAVVPDSNEYGSPMKIYEYMAMGKPVVAPRLGPLEDGIESGKEGILFTQKSSDEFLSALRTIILDESLRKKMNNAARNKIRRKHNWLHNAHQVIRMYEEIKKGVR